MSDSSAYGKKIWTESYARGVPRHVDYQDILISQYLEQSAKAFPHNSALIFQGYAMTFTQLNDTVCRFATALKKFGIKKGDRVAILLPNVIPCVVAYYATLKIGGIVVFNNPLYADRELEPQFTDSGVKCLITLDLLADRMVKLRKKTDISTIVYTSICDYLSFGKRLFFPLLAKKNGLTKDVGPAPNLYKFQDVIAKYAPDTSQADVTMDDVAMYQYTGGTTGASKGVMLSHRNISYQVQQLEAWFPEFVKGQETMLGALPFFHVFGMSTSMNYAIKMGWRNVLVPKPQSDPLLEAISKFKVSFAPMVPTMYIGMLDHPNMGKIDLSSIRACFSGSAPLPLDVINTFQKKTSSIIVEGFGLTECTPVTHINPFQGKRVVGSIGLPISDTVCKIVDLEDHTRQMPIGESGELLIKGPQVMKGYLNQPNATAKTITEDGFLCSGDIAQMDENGYFYIVDRIKDIIISGGYNVYPRDIDEVLFEHPNILEACAIGIPHPKRGEAVKAFVILKEGETMTEKDVIDYCGTKLAKYKLPVAVEFRNELPKSNVGKILRKELRAEEQNKESPFSVNF
ncbi:long-chain fatty acid--CoA ligase [Desulfobacter hydrogenophilus]|uniref:Long-chain fatty acid--CoA ligase n=1 Tax=Desulfobacter hydrogenophilus TaxID=2291 RepID=A0A328FAA5_9BACT|nr:long-chain fatty acid--CoA ligase [Desulfobacter hydrogenophilus]NDY72529.1 long-chain fatty acid--CoA ligase [Desulfobacter hydrogenophilus]QBH14140.1 long-chain fatty acid--CoA ligase [Desulfobacter hydrogenophilus]RAM01571.1 long-chain fatty acid--CoA ligase [Desulfobacter hydrogenophilus]